MLQSCDHLCGPLLDLVWSAGVCPSLPHLSWGAPQWAQHSRWVELDAILTDQCLHVKVPWSSSVVVPCVSPSCQFIICGLSEGAFCPVIQVINGDVRQYRCKCWPLRLQHQWLASLWISCTGHSCVSQAVQPGLSLYHSHFIYPSAVCL